MELPIEDRTAAGRALAAALEEYRGREDVIVLALPRGGVPVGYEVAAGLGVDLDLMLVRKLGTPGQSELAMGAIASGGVRILNDDVVNGLGIQQQTIEAVAAEEQEVLETRERNYRGDRARPAIEGRTVILVDDGLATGSTMRAAVAALRVQDPARVLIAVPVAPPDTVKRLKGEADEVIALATPAHFMAIGQFYRRFDQTSDEEVKRLLGQAWQVSA